MELSRRVPARTKTITARWCKRDWMPMSDKFREIRGRSRNSMDTCYWCHKGFQNGDMMALACFDNKGNKVLCQACADELIASDATPARENGE